MGLEPETPRIFEGGGSQWNRFQLPPPPPWAWYIHTSLLALMEPSPPPPFLCLCNLDHVSTGTDSLMDRASVACDFVVWGLQKQP